MKKFLLLWAVFALCAAPLMAEGAPYDYNNATETDLQTAIQNAVNAHLTGDTPNDEELALTITFSGPAIAITVENVQLPQTVYLTGSTVSFDVVKSVTITNDNLTLNSSTAGARHFTIGDGGKLTFNNAVTIKGMTTSGGIELSGSGEVEFTGKVTFDTNQPTGKAGGALSLEGTATAKFNGDAEFKNNKGTSGGAINVAGGTVTFANDTTVSFSGNSATTGNGGAINISSATASVNFNTPTELNFKSNSSTSGNGGAIYTALDGLTIPSTAKFEKNTATNGNGGAICASDTASVKINGGTFGSSGNANSAKEGGAVYAKMVTLSGTPKFEYNTATKQGGAIRTLDTNTTLTINSQEFNHNTAGSDNTTEETYGGAIYAAGPLTITAGTFQENAAGNTTMAGHGGAIYAGGKVDVTAGTFEANKATGGEGGAIRSEGAVTLGTGTVTFGGDATTKGNTANSGGAIYATAVTLGTGTYEFKHNVAATDGGAIYAETGGATITSNTTFANNTATAGNGGAIHALAGKVTVTGGSFESNAATAAQGGAIYTAAGDVSISSSATFESNTAGTSGGAVYATGAVTIDSGIFTTNKAVANGADATADHGGGAVYATGTVNISGNATFQGNVSGNTGDASGGGAIYSLKSVNVKGGSFAGTSGEETTQNKATGGSGGAIYAVENITVADSNGGEITFSYQSAKKNGGALYAATGNIDVTKVRFLNNSATDSNGGGDGGATYSGGKSTISNCFFTSNTAAHSGGASRASTGLTVSNTTYHENMATTSGGAISLWGGASNVVQNCVFDGNTATGGLGGAIHENGSDTELTVKDSVFQKDQAAKGGAIGTETTPARLTLLRCTFSNKNTATGTGDGGAVYSDAGKFLIANCTFYENIAGGNGGALCLAAGNKSAIVFCTFAKNTAGSSGSGGAIHSLANFTMGANIMVQNSASEGGDLYKAAGTIKSAGYNYFTAYSEAGNSSVSWTSTSYADDTDEYKNIKNTSEAITYSLLFGTAVLDENGTTQDGVDIPPAVGSTLTGAGTYTLNTLALRESTEDSPNPAQVVIERASGQSVFGAAGTEAIADGYTDERGLNRPSQGNNPKWDVGAYDSGKGNNGGGDDPNDDGSIYYIRISGIPNNLRTVGQTASLIANGYDIHWNLVERDVDVTWSSSHKDVAKFVTANSGNIRIYGLGTTTITAKYGDKEDAKELTVDKEMSYTNVHEDFWKVLDYAYEDSLASLTFADANPALLKSSSFQSKFKSLWNSDAVQITSLQDSSQFRASAKKSSSGGLPGVYFALTGRAVGEVLPVQYQWIYTWEELSKILGHTVTSKAGLTNLEALKISFESYNGSSFSVIGTGKANSVVRLQSTDGVSATDAINTGVLNTGDAHNGVAFYLTAYLANVQSSATSASAGPQFVNGLLVVPDGVADNAISGTMWMGQAASSSEGSGGNTGSGGSGGGGGGGCGVLTGTGAAGFALLLLLLVPVRARKR